MDDEGECLARSIDQLAEAHIPSPLISLHHNLPLSLSGRHSTLVAEAALRPTLGTQAKVGNGRRADGGRHTQVDGRAGMDAAPDARTIVDALALVVRGFTVAVEGLKRTQDSASSLPGTMGYLTLAPTRLLTYVARGCDDFDVTVGAGLLVRG